MSEAAPIASNEVANVGGEGSVAEQAEFTGEEFSPEDEEYSVDLDGEGEDEAEDEPIEGEDPPDFDHEGEPRGKQKLSAQERIQQEISRRKAAEDQLGERDRRIAVLEQRFEQSQQQAAPYVDVDMEKLSRHLDNLRDEAEELRLDGKPIEAAMKDREYARLIDAYEQNERAKNEALKQRSADEQKAQAYNEFMVKLDRAAEFYRAENQIPQDVWDTAGEWLAQRFQENRTLQLEFDDRARVSPIAAIKWAHGFIEEHMAQEAQAAKQGKQEAKKRLVGGASAGGGEASKFRSYEQLMGLGSRAVVAFQRNNPTAYKKLFDAHMRKGEGG